jgi:hypothetical protein
LMCILNLDRWCKYEIPAGQEEEGVFSLSWCCHLYINLHTALEAGGMHSHPDCLSFYLKINKTMVRKLFLHYWYCYYVNGFRVEFFFIYKSTNQKQELPMTAMFINRSGQN